MSADDKKKRRFSKADGRLIVPKSGPPRPADTHFPKNVIKTNDEMEELAFGKRKKVPKVRFEP